MSPRLLLAALLVSGCTHYWIPQKSLDAFATVPDDDKRLAVVPATRIPDGKATFVRAGEAKLDPRVEGTRTTPAPPDEPRASGLGERRARVLRPLTVAGIPLLITGTAWFLAGAMLLFPGLNCGGAGDSCGLSAFSVGLPMFLVGNIELALGTSFVVYGARSVEVPAHAAHFQFLP